MKRRDFMFQTGVATLAASSVPWLMGAEGKKKKILYFDLSNEFEHPPTINEADGTSYGAKVITKMGKELGYDVICTKDGTVFDGDLSDYAAFVFYTCGNLDKTSKKWDAAGGPPKGMKPLTSQGVDNFYKAIRSGTGFVGIHSATDTWKTPGPAYENQPESKRTEYVKMIGGNFIVHGAQQETTLTFTEPIQLPSLKAMGETSCKHFDEWYCMKNFNKDMHVILVQETKDMKHDGHNACYDRPAYPSTWARMEGKGRVTYTSLGHGNEMWKKPLVKGVIYDLLSYVVGNYDMDLTPNIDKVCPGASTLKNK